MSLVNVEDYGLVDLCLVWYLSQAACLTVDMAVT